jgi:hypothetical protein
MSSFSIRHVLASVLLVIVAAPRASAEPLMAGSFTVYIEAIQDITLFTPNGPDLIPNVTGFGEITFNYAAETNNTVNLTSLSGGMFVGSNPSLGSYVFGNVPPLSGADFTGSISNIVQNVNDPGYATGSASSFQSGDLTFGGNQFGFMLTPSGPTFLTDPASSFSFSSTFDGLPPSIGTIFSNSGPDVLGVYLGSMEIGTSSNRRLIVIPAPVPEPSAVILLAIAAAGLCGYARKRSTKKD